MKFFSFGLLAMTFLFVANTFSQNTIKEDLKLVEQNCIALKLDSIATKISDLKSANPYDFIGFNGNQSMDSLIVFVATQKQIAAATFETNIKPFLEEKLLEGEKNSFDFSDEEELIFESFLNILNYNNVIVTVKLYEDFIIKNYKDQTLMANILTVLSCIKYVCFYVSKKTEDSFFNYTIDCFEADLKSYNVLNWKVFAANPEAISLWTIAACAWDYKSGK